MSQKHKQFSCVCHNAVSYAYINNNSVIYLIERRVKQSISDLIAGKYSLQIHIAPIQSQSKRLQYGIGSCTNSCSLPKFKLQKNFRRLL